MAITAERVREIPEPYKTFLQMLWPVIGSQEDDSVIKITGIPFWMIHRAMADRHRYSEVQVREIAETLRERGWVEWNELGFYVPKGEGIAVLRAINQPQKVPTVPALPAF